MKTLTKQVADNIEPDVVAAALYTGQGAAHHRGHAALAAARSAVAATRARYGFESVAAPILTDPASNMKLAKGDTPAYGITLQHHVTTLESGLRVNACPKAGQCTAVCVLDTGSGAYHSVQRARKWKTHLLAHEPFHFFVMLGYEIERAVMRHGTIYLRPNVNSDVAWEQIAPALVDGSVFGDAVTFYGYTKLEYVLYEGGGYKGDGWITPHYRVAYSYNEKSVGMDAVIEGFMCRGGSMAVVTNRKRAIGYRKEPEALVQWHTWCEVLDADLSDEWIFQSSVIGDLAAKGKATKLIQPRGSAKPSFVQTVY
jgi:hypothetical protein